MNYSIVLQKGERFIIWVYKNITNKFIGTYSKIRDRFPIIDRKPILKYSLIPLFLALLVSLRYTIKFIINELAAWTSGFVGETSSLNVSEKTIVISIAVVIISLRIGLQIRSQRKKRNKTN